MLFAFIFPQLDDLSRPQLREVVKYLHRRVLRGMSLAVVVRVVAEAMQTPVQEITPPVDAQEGETEEIDEEEQTQDDADMEPA